MKQYAYLIKIKDCESPLHANHIPPGYSRIGEVEAVPKVGESFVVGSWGTSTVQAIIDDRTFRTHNSIYEWSLIEMSKNGQEAMKKLYAIDNANKLMGFPSEEEIYRQQHDMWVEAAMMIIKNRNNWSIDEVMDQFTINRKEK